MFFKDGVIGLYQSCGNPAVVFSFIVQFCLSKIGLLACFTKRNENSCYGDNDGIFPVLTVAKESIAYINRGHAIEPLFANSFSNFVITSDNIRFRMGLPSEKQSSRKSVLQVFVGVTCFKKECTCEKVRTLLS